MSNNRDVKDFITQLQNLQIQQATLISRLECLSEGGENTSGPTPVPTSTTREFKIGDHRVRIRNPRRLQVIRGKIVRVGASRITVEAKNGTTIVRAPKNLYFDKRERGNHQCRPGRQHQGYHTIDIIVRRTRRRIG
jgi:hypothetical protein